MTVGASTVVSRFPHRIDLASGEVTLVEVDREDLRSQAFLDGREQFWLGPVERIGLAGLSHELGSPDGLERFIFHFGFCGSTLLGRLLDRPGGVLVLREPRILTDLSAYRSGLDQIGDDDAGVGEALIVICRLLSRRWTVSEAVVIKPSNWVNNLIPFICADPTRVRPLFLTMRRRAFVRAVIRGGSERLAFCARAAVHFSAASTADAEQVERVLRQDAEPLDKLVTLTALTHRFQSNLFDEAKGRGGWSDEQTLSLDDLTIDPLGAVMKAESALGLHASAGCLHDGRLSRHSKHPDQPFSQAVQDASDARIEAEHGLRIDKAMALSGD